jgi:hypothetical protein
MSEHRAQRGEVFDVTARKFHQTVCVALVAAGFVLGGHAGAVLVALVGVVMLGGRFWWPLDVFRQLVWRVLEPRGIVRRRDVEEDHSTRRVARILGGVVFLLGALALGLGDQLAWLAIGAIAVMISLDAAFNFCALCALTYRVGRLSARLSS